MIRLDTTTRKLQALLSGAPATNQLPCTSSYSDKTATAYTGDTTVINTNSGTAVDIVGAPAASTVRDVDHVNIYNADTAPVTLTVRYNDNGTLYILWSGTLAVGQTLEYTHAGGWRTGSPFPVSQSGTWTVNLADGAGNLLTSNSTTYTAKKALDGNLLGTLGTAFSTAGKVDVKAADGDVFVRQATAGNLNATVVFASAQAVTQSGTWTVATNADTTIAGTTAPGKLLLVGGKTADGTPAYDPLPLAAGGGSVVVSGTVSTSGTSTVSGTVTANAGTGIFTVDASGHTVPVSGTFWQATQPVSEATLDACISGNKVAVSGTLTANPTPPSDVTATGTITTGAGSNVTVATAGCATVGVIVTGTWTGTLTFKATIDGTNWDTIDGYQVSSLPQLPATVSISSNGRYLIPCGGFKQVQLLGPTSTGSATVTFEASAAPQILSVNVYPVPNPFPITISAAMATVGVTQSGVWNINQTNTTPGFSAAVGVGTIATGQVSVGNTATSIVSGRAARRSVTIVNLGTTDVYIGTSGVTTSTGLLLAGIKGAALTLELGNVAVYGIVASGTQSVAYLEEY